MSDNLLALLGRFDRIGRAIETTLLVLVLSVLILVAAGQIVLREFFDIGFIWANELQNPLACDGRGISATCCAPAVQHG